MQQPAAPKSGLDYNDFTIVHAVDGTAAKWISTPETGYEWGVGAGGELVVLSTKFDKTFAARLTGPEKIVCFAAETWQSVKVHEREKVQVVPKGEDNVLVLPTPVSTQ